MGIYEKYFRKKVFVSEPQRVDDNLNRDYLKAVIAYNKYGAYCIPISAQFSTLGQKILRGDIFEPDTIDFMRSNAKDGDIIHAGSFFGDFLPGLSKALNSDAIIWSFEPNRENFRCAEVTILINDLKNVKLFPSGLGETQSMAFLKTVNRKGLALGGSSTIVDLQPNEEEIEEISIVAVDEIIPKNRNISIIQLDVEGYEENALKGAIETIKRCRPILILEDDQSITKSNWFINNILSLDYEVSGKLHYNKVVLPKEKIEQ